MTILLEFVVYIAIFSSASIGTFLVTRRLYKNTPINLDNTPVVDVTQEPKLHSQAPIRKLLPGEVKIPQRGNDWKLEVNGAVKFDIKVEWSNGATSVYSGTAPQMYQMNKPVGVIPVNTSGIPPEWADDGISYQWELNGYHWC